MTAVAEPVLTRRSRPSPEVTAFDRPLAPARRATTSNPAAPDRPLHEPALDGLRGLAVIAVMLFHFQPGWLPGGFLGVDTFMVVSGFLITRLLLAEWDRTSTIGLRAFWGRRARRLVPALLVVLAAVAAVSAAWMPPSQLAQLRSDAFAALGYVANWHLIDTHQSYVSAAGTPSPLRHMWSLAIEEQYYVVWPLVVLACLRLRRFGRPLLGAACVAGIGASVFAMTRAFVPGDPSRAYYGTDTRAQTLLVGAGLALLVHARSGSGRRSARSTSRVLPAAAAVVAAWQLWLWTHTAVQDSWLYQGGFLAYALGTALLIWAALERAGHPSGTVASALRTAPLRAVGRVSYGLYLWHWPVFVFLTPGRTGFGGLALLALRTAVTVALTVASYVLIEQPFRHRRVPARAVRVVAPLAVVGVVGAFMVVGLGAEPLPRYLRSTDSAAAAEPEIVKAKPTAAARPPAGLRSTTPVLGPVTSEPTATTAPIPVVLPKTAVIEGDSVSASIEDRLAEELAARGVSTVKSAVPGCGMITGSPLDPAGQPYAFGPACSEQVQTRQRHDVETYRPDLVVWLSSWEARNREIDGRRYDLGTPEGDRAILRLMRESVARLTASGAKVVVVTLPTPYDTAEVTHPEGLIESVPKLNELLRRLAAGDPDHVGLVELAPIVCGEGNTAAADCPHERDGISLRADGLHYGEAGADWLAPRLTDALLADHLWQRR